MFKIRKGDTVQVITGDDKDKKGKVLKVLPQQNRAIVEGVNLVKKHKRRTQQDQQTGIITIESPLKLSNLMIICRHCNQMVRVGFKTLADGTKSRFCKSCKELI